VHVSPLNPLRRFHRSLLPLMPMALESFDLRPYDLVISSESGPAKGVITSSTTRHVCYCHTPMRYLWDLYPAYRNDFGQGPLRRLLMAPFANYLRTWDLATASRVDAFLANSRNVRRRVWKTYRRRSHVVYPPVAVESFTCEPAEDYLLAVSELVPYKRLDYAVRLFASTGRKLKIAGDGPEYRALKRIAGRSIEFCGRVPDSQLHELYAHCAGFLMPGEEDFGIVMVEALASGKPVIALCRGGAVEIVTEGCGVLFPEPSAECLAEALRGFDRLAPAIPSSRLQQRAATFSEDAFRGDFLKWARPPGLPGARSAPPLSGQRGMHGPGHNGSGFSTSFTSSLPSGNDSS
jgi:glycosyltransferase involved in cell wall biosynthesis